MQSGLHDSSDTIALSVEQTVPRSLVHKRSLENVLLTELGVRRGDRFICAGRVPTAHRFFNDACRSPLADILFYTELGRQASLAISHHFLNVSRDDVFIFEGSDAALLDGAWHAAARPDSESVVVEVKTREIAKRKNDVVNRVVADHLMWAGGQQVFRGTGAWTIQPAALFRRLRRSAAAHLDAPAPDAAAATPAHLPHATRDNVVISAPRPAGTGRDVVASLIVDRSHPYFFDHACDHVPGMLLLEACAQLALTAAGQATGAARIVSYDMTFEQFVECQLPATLTAHSSDDGCGTDGARSVPISIAQNGVECGRARIGVMTTEPSGW